MTDHEPESANRWATEHYGFQDVAADQQEPALDAVTAATQAVPSRDVAPPSRRRSTLIAAGLLSLTLVAGIGGTAVASDDGPLGGRDGITHVDRGQP